MIFCVICLDFNLKVVDFIKIYRKRTTNKIYGEKYERCRSHIATCIKNKILQ